MNQRNQLQASALDAFWSSLNGGLPGLSPAESELLDAILSLAEKARQLLPQGVSLQDWAERRVPAHLVPEVNRSGFIFVAGAGASTGPGARGGNLSRSPVNLARAEAGLELSPTFEKATVRPSMVRSLVAGVKSLSAGLLGVVFRPLSRKAAGELQVPENNFYYDPVAKRWRQPGVEDVDVSTIDPNTGRRKDPDLSAMLGPPPTSGCTSHRPTGATSLYVDPLAPAAQLSGPPAAPPVAYPAPQPVLQPVLQPAAPEGGPLSAAWAGAGGDGSLRPGPVETLAGPEASPIEPPVRVTSPGLCGPGDGSLVPGLRSQV